MRPFVGGAAFKKRDDFVAQNTVTRCAPDRYKDADDKRPRIGAFGKKT
jgi:hypothetical protein